MVAPTEQAERGPATYVPEPFEGLPEVFNVEEQTQRSWRKLRPTKSPRRQKGAEAPAVESIEDPLPRAPKAFREPATTPAPVLDATPPAGDSEPARLPVVEPVAEPVVEPVAAVEPATALVPAPAPELAAEPVVAALAEPEPTPPSPVLSPRALVTLPPLPEIAAEAEPVPELPAVPPVLSPRALVTLPPLPEIAPEPAPEPPAVEPEPFVASKAEPELPVPSPRSLVTLPPLPEIAPEPEPEPPAAEPEQVAAIEPEPITDVVVEPEPITDVVVEPEPVADVVVEPEPVADVVVEPEPVVALVAEPHVEPVRAPHPEPAPEPAVAEVAQAVAPPTPPAVVEPSPAPQPAPRPVVESAAQPSAGRRPVFAAEVAAAAQTEQTDHADRPGSRDEARPQPQLQEAGRPEHVAAAPQPAAPAASNGYEPEPYEPAAAAEFGHIPQLLLPSGYGVVYPSRRTGRGVWFILFLVVAVAGSFLGWRVLRGNQHEAAAPAVLYRSTAGHFRAQFPAQPIAESRTERHGKNRFVVHGATDAVSATSVLALDITGPIPGDHKRAIRDVLNAISSADDMTITGVRAGSFHGHSARYGTYLAPSGDLVTVLVVAYSVHRYYLLMAPKGAGFDALAKSFDAVR